MSSSKILIDAAVSHWKQKMTALPEGITLASVLVPRQGKGILGKAEDNTVGNFNMIYQVGSVILAFSFVTTERKPYL